MIFGKEKFEKEIAGLDALSESADPLSREEMELMRQKILKAIAALEPETALFSRRINFNWLVNSAIAAVLGLSVLAGTAFAAGNSIPGDTLYPVKIAAEKVELSLAVSQQSKTGLQVKFAGERLSELQKLAAKAAGAAPGLPPAGPPGNPATATLPAVFPAFSAGSTQNATSPSSTTVTAPPAPAPNSPNNELAQLRIKAEADAAAQVNVALGALRQEQANLQNQGNASAAADIGKNILNLQADALAQNVNIGGGGGADGQAKNNGNQKNSDGNVNTGSQGGQSAHKSKKVFPKTDGLPKQNNLKVNLNIPAISPPQNAGKQNAFSGTASSTINININQNWPGQGPATTTGQAPLQLPKFPGFPDSPSATAPPDSINFPTTTPDGFGQMHNQPFWPNQSGQNSQATGSSPFNFPNNFFK